MTAVASKSQSIESWLGEEAENLLNYKPKVSKQLLNIPGSDWVERIFANSDRSPQVLRSLQQLYSTGRLANTGYLSILPVDQGIEHSAAASFAPNPAYFDPENIGELPTVKPWASYPTDCLVIVDFLRPLLVGLTSGQ